MNFNTLNNDLFVAAYGNFSMGNQNGMIALWTLKNPYQPESYIETKESVLTAKFSKKNPNLFACGFLNGNLNIYDTRMNLSKPIVKSEDL